MAISMLLEMAADTYDDRIALGSTDGGVSYAGLRRAAEGGAALIRKAGAKHVALVGINGPVFPQLLFAAAIAGVPFTPLNYRLSAEQLAGQLDELGSPLVVADEAYADAVPVVHHRTEEWYDAATAAEPGEADFVDDDAPAVVLFTSGTTSKPKMVLLRHAHLVSYVLHTVEFASADPDAAALISVPPYHIAGVGTILSNVYAGRRMVYLPNFTAPGWLELVRREGVTNAMVVPTMLARIVEELGSARADVPSLQAIAYGGARMPVNVLEAALAAFPDVAFANAYGLTETSSTIAVLGPDDHRLALTSAEPHLQRRLASVGRLVPGVEGQVRSEDGAVLPVGEVGEIWVRGPQVSGEYVGLGSSLDADGWFPTKDRGSFDPEGYLYIEGRSDDTIIRGGENIAPAEIEDVLVRHPDIREAAVVGVPDDEWGERIVAVCVIEAGASLDPDTVRTFVRERLRGSRTPDDVVFVGELPYTQTGKLLRRELVEQLISAT